MAELDPEQFIDDRSIQWGLLLATFAGSGLYATWTGFATVINNGWWTLRQLASGAGSGTASVLGDLLAVPVNGLEAAFLELEAWIMLLGIWAFPVGVLLTLVTIELTVRGIRYGLP